MAEKVCGKCNYWQRSSLYAWGYCGAELPAWVHDDQSPVVFHDDKLAVDCDLYCEADGANDDEERAREGAVENRIAQEIDERIGDE